MSWRIEMYAPGVIAVHYEGPTTAADLRESTTRAIALGKERIALNYLVDSREIELHATTFDLYDLPARQYVEEHLDRRSRVAVVLPQRPYEQEQARFYQTACVNRGWLVQLFATPETALDWLCGTGSGTTPLASV